jgi:hypothetical protein
LFDRSQGGPDRTRRKEKATVSPSSAQVCSPLLSPLRSTLLQLSVVVAVFSCYHGPPEQLLDFAIVRSFIVHLAQLLVVVRHHLPLGSILSVISERNALGGVSAPLFFVFMIELLAWSNSPLPSSLLSSFVLILPCYFCRLNKL